MYEKNYTKPVNRINNKRDNFFEITMNNTLRFYSILLVIVLGSLSTSLAQISGVILGQDTTRRPIFTAVPFLSIAPDARSAAMGDVGAALSPDANSIYWNAAKIPFSEKQYGFSLSYTPWLRNLVDDMSIAFLSGYYKIDNRQSFAGSLRYFNLGSIEFTTETGATIANFTPQEFAFAGNYSRKLSDKIGVGVTGRFIYSNLTGAVIQDARPGVTGAADVSFFYTNDKFQFSGRPSVLSFGAVISNIGAKISYGDANQQDFIPTNLRVGTALTTSLDPQERNKLTIGLDFNKLLSPTPPLVNSQGQILSGQDPRERTLLSGIFGSFTDAPNGFSEELQEIMIATGLEYKYLNMEGQDVFAARAGYFYEAKNKGNRRYFTIGVGINYKKIGFDVAYLIPQGQQQGNPLAETLRFTVSLNIEKAKERVFEGS